MSLSLEALVEMLCFAHGVAVHRALGEFADRRAQHKQAQKKRPHEEGGGKAAKVPKREETSAPPEV